MLQLFQPRPDLKAAHVFADFLEAILDLAEELELLYLIPSDDEREPGSDVLPGLDRIGAFVERIETIEVAIAVKLGLARAAARRIAEADNRLQTFTKLFHAGTQPLVELCAELADPGRRIFESGHDPLTFLQARGVVDECRSTLESQSFLATGPDYRLLGTVKLGAFIELCDTCLQAIDRHYHLYADDAEWEAERALTLDILRERRDEAIRFALGAALPPIETPVEIVAAVAVEEAIELIEALTFPEERRFEVGPPPMVARDVPDEAPLVLGPETAAELAPVEIEELAEGPVESTASVVPTETPVELSVESVVEGPAAEATPDAAKTTADSVEANEPAAKPSLLDPIAAAGRSLAAILARRKLAAARTPAAPAPESVAAETGEPASTQADVVVETEPLVEAAFDVAAAMDEPADAAREPDPEVAASVPDAASATPGLKGARQRLLEVIAERLRVLPERPMSALVPARVVEIDALSDVSEAREPGDDVPHGTTSSEPFETAAAAPDLIEPFASAEPGLDQISTDVAPVPAPESLSSAPVAAVDAPGGVSAPTADALSEPTAAKAGPEDSTPAATGPASRKRPRRTSRHKAIRKRRRTQAG
jgi:hypothetical protein